MCITIHFILNRLNMETDMLTKKAEYEHKTQQQ